MACPRCGGIERTTLPDSRYVCESPVQVNGPLLDVVPPHISGTTAGVPIYGEPQWRACGNVYTQQESEAASRYWEAKAASDRGLARAVAAARAAKHPVERLIRAAAAYGTVGAASPRVDFGSNQVAFWTLSGAVSRNNRGGDPAIDDESVAAWFASRAHSLGLKPDGVMPWPEEKLPRFRKRRFGEPVKVGHGAMTEVWRIPAPLITRQLQGPAQDGLIAVDGRLGLVPGWPDQTLGDSALIYLAGRLGYPVNWKTPVVPAPTGPQRATRG